MICKVMPKVWQIRSRADNAEIGLFASEAECVAYFGTERIEKYGHLYEWSEIDCDAVFVIMKEGDHFDGGDQLMAIAGTYAKAQALIVELKKKKEHRSDVFEIEIHEVQDGRVVQQA